MTQIRKLFNRFSAKPATAIPVRQHADNINLGLMSRSKLIEDILLNKQDVCFT